MLGVTDEEVAGALGIASAGVAATCAAWSLAISNELSHLTRPRRGGFRLNDRTTPSELALTDGVVTTLLEMFPGHISLAATTTASAETRLGADLLVAYETPAGRPRFALFQAKVVDYQRGAPRLRHGLTTGHHAALCRAARLGVPSYLLLYTDPNMFAAVGSHVIHLPPLSWRPWFWFTPQQWFDRHTSLCFSAQGALAAPISSISGPVTTSPSTFRSVLGSVTWTPWEFLFSPVSCSLDLSGSVVRANDDREELPSSLIDDLMDAYQEVSRQLLIVSIGATDDQQGRQ